MYYISYQIPSPTDLQHHGILGMKWGVRRYQNKDGSLTAAGQRRYGNMSGEQTYKTLKRQVQSQRAKTKGSYNRWASREGIGENSDKLIKERRESEKEFENSKEYRDWAKKISDLDRKSESMSNAEYSKKYRELVSQMPERHFNTLQSVTITERGGKKYLDDFINKGGRDLSMAYLKDLGYNEEVAEEFVKKMAKANRTLGSI